MIDVVCGVIEGADRQFLACLRPQGKHLGGQWEFPGGKVDAGESPETALARELKEELGVIVHVGEPLREVVWHYEGRSIRLLPFFCTILSGELTAIEHDELRWCAPDEFDGLAWAAADRPILDEIQANAEMEGRHQNPA
jgi:8-oxo-dGTP diphosphatase